ncbi:hypothetical protein V8E51_013140 [Hyaloscypha variabilis]
MACTWFRKCPKCFSFSFAPSSFLAFRTFAKYQRSDGCTPPPPPTTSCPGYGTLAVEVVVHHITAGRLYENVLSSYDSLSYLIQRGHCVFLMRREKRERVWSKKFLFHRKPSLLDTPSLCRLELVVQGGHKLGGPGDLGSKDAERLGSRLELFERTPSITCIEIKVVGNIAISTMSLQRRNGQPVWVLPAPTYQTRRPLSNTKFM